MSNARPRILYVDDHADTREMLRVLLEIAGYEVRTAASCAEAMAMIAGTKFDLFILDYHLPDGAGSDLCINLKKLHPEVPILYYSAVVLPDHIEKTLHKCGDAYLKKPVSMEELDQAIKLLLARGVGGPSCSC
jgi:DNA-binding response OmpR family regulator